MNIGISAGVILFCSFYIFLFFSFLLRFFFSLFIIIDHHNSRHWINKSIPKTIFDKLCFYSVTLIQSEGKQCISTFHLYWLIADNGSGNTPNENLFLAFKAYSGSKKCKWFSQTVVNFIPINVRHTFSNQISKN